MSEEARRVYTLRFGDKKALHIIPNGVQKFDICERTGRSVETVLTLARVAPVKNPQLWATVADRVGQERADVSFVWAGPTNGDEEMTALVEEHRGSGRTGRFVGEAANVAEVLATSDILFHPSDRESSGLSVLEAIGTGLPVVCSDQVASGLEPSLIEETFPSGDIEGAVQAVLRVIARYPQAIQKSVGRSVLVQQLHGMDKCAAAYLRLFSGHTKAVDVTHRKSEYQKASPIDGSDSELPGARS